MWRHAHSLSQTRKNTNQTTPRIKTARPVETSRRASTDGPGSACRASVGVSTIWRWCCGAIGGLDFSMARQIVRRKMSGQRMISGDVPSFDAGGIGSDHLKGSAATGTLLPVVRPATQLQLIGSATVNVVGRFLNAASLKPGSAVVSSRYICCVFRSIPWPPVPTGKAFCAFRS